MTTIYCNLEKFTNLRSDSRTRSLQLFMLTQLSQLAKVDLTRFNKSFVESTLRARMDELKCLSLSDYLDRLKLDASEADRLRKALTNNYSLFFRNPLTFSFLESHILPLLAQQKAVKQTREIRIWSAACASGQEAYSIAMVCDEFARQHTANIRFHIFATDISTDELLKAREAVYSEMNMKNVTYDRLVTYFTPVGKGFRVNQQLTERVDFSAFDLLCDDCLCPSASIYGNFDIIFCANLLFYYQPEMQVRILQKMNNCLAAGGWLIVGDAEKEIVASNTDYLAYKYFTVLQKPLKNNGD